MLKYMKQFYPKKNTSVFLVYRENHQITPAAQGGAADSVRLLLTKNPVCSFNYPSARHAVYRLNGSRDPGRQLARYRVPSFVLTALWGAGGTQCAVDSGLVLMGRRAIRCSPSASPRSCSFMGEQTGGESVLHRFSGLPMLLLECEFCY